MIRFGFRGGAMLPAATLLAVLAALAPPAQARLIRKGTPHYSGGRAAHMAKTGHPSQFGMHKPGGRRLKRVAP